MICEKGVCGFPTVTTIFRQLIICLLLYMDVTTCSSYFTNLTLGRSTAFLQKDFLLEHSLWPFALAWRLATDEDE